MAKKKKKFPGAKLRNVPVQKVGSPGDLTIGGEGLEEGITAHPKLQPVDVKLPASTEILEGESVENMEFKSALQGLANQRAVHKADPSKKNRERLQRAFDRFQKAKSALPGRSPQSESVKFKNEMDLIQGAFTARARKEGRDLTSEERKKMVGMFKKASTEMRDEGFLDRFLSEQGFKIPGKKKKKKK